MKKERGLYIALINAHGLLRGDRLELGRDADTGGQTKYVVELARALIKHPGVEKVDILTRLIVDEKVSSDYAKLVEEMAPGLNIIRIPFGPRRYLRKEALWPYMDNFADTILKYWRSIGREPDLIHSHYADAGYVGARLAGALGIPLAHTGHSLGREKKRRLLRHGIKIEKIQSDLHIGRRIEAEETALDYASFVVASTRQEVEEQYSLYDNYHPERMVVIPPGVDLSRFSPPPAKTPLEKVNFYGELAKFVREPGKPLVLTLSRADMRKNVATLIRAYGENETLREKANLMLVVGSREDIKTMDKGARDVLYEMLALIDYYDLYGKVAYPKKHTAEDAPDIYRLAARTRGVFVNPALTEPFGLTLIEAAASGLPIVATEDGGPRDIVSHCKNGLLVDPTDKERMGEAILEVISDGKKWRRWSKSGLDGASKHFSWDSHIEKYMEAVEKQIGEHRRKQTRPIVKSRLITADRVLVTGLDGILMEDEEGLERLLEILDEAAGAVALAVVTGRGLDMTLEALNELGAPTPNILITSAGSEIYYGPNLVEDYGWRRHIEYRWRPDKIREALGELPGLTLQPEWGQGRMKISYYTDADEAPKTREIIRRLRKTGLSANVVLSHGSFLDVLPMRASKSLALRYLAVKWGIPIERFLVAGVSAAEEDMLLGDTLGVVVGNHDQELNKLRHRPRVYFAEGRGAWGIIEAMERYDFFGEIRAEAKVETQG
ncbi:MAG: HAD family hydrolase [Candidatus Nitrospinota bacterium M3_3B_026]